MKRIIWEDKRGWLRCSVLDDNADESEAEMGVPYNPPDFTNIDFEDLCRELNNELVKKELIVFSDIQKQNSGLQNTVLSVILPKIVSLYKQESYRNG